VKSRPEEGVDDEVRGLVELLGRLAPRLAENAERDASVTAVRPFAADTASG
jgi:hypothetical protein